jgi:hypothetical protein
MAKPRSPVFAIIIGLLVLAGALGVAVGTYNVVRGPVVQTLRLTELAPLPRTAHDVSASSVDTPEGFTVLVRFAAPLPDLELWLQHSPAMRGLAPTREGTVRRYELKPVGKAKRASVKLDEAAEQAEIALVHG